MRTFPYFVLLLCCAPLLASDPPFRTDAAPADTKLRWFQLKPAEFPPANSAHHIGGELIELDHLNRTASIRRDRDDTQRPDTRDHAIPFTMLPYGSISYHGAPAELRDLPIGTHLHGQFYIEAKAAKDKSDDRAKFDRCLKLEDDFSYCTRLKRAWRVDAVALDK